MDFRLKLKLDFPMHANTYFVDTNTLTEAIERKKMNLRKIYYITIFF